MKRLDEPDAANGGRPEQPDVLNIPDYHDSRIGFEQVNEAVAASRQVHNVQSSPPVGEEVQVEPSTSSNVEEVELVNVREEEEDNVERGDPEGQERLTPCPPTEAEQDPEPVLVLEKITEAVLDELGVAGKIETVTTPPPSVNEEGGREAHVDVPVDDEAADRSQEAKSPDAEIHNTSSDSEEYDPHLHDTATLRIVKTKERDAGSCSPPGTESSV